VVFSRIENSEVRRRDIYISKEVRVGLAAKGWHEELQAIKSFNDSKFEANE